MEKEKIKLTQKKAENSPAGGVVVGERDGQTMIYDDASVGGYFVGKTHKEGGIQMINKSNGQPLEVQGAEVIITAPAVADQTKREFEGKMMTNREILSAINEKGGGVAFAKGGDIPKNIKRTGASYNYGGQTMTDHEIYKYITGGGIAEDFSIRDIANIHQVPLAELKEEVRIGMLAESEHKGDKKDQMEIVKDHLLENPKYYTLLKKAGLVEEDTAPVEKSKWLKQFYVTNNPSIDKLLKDLQPKINELIEKQKELVIKESTRIFGEPRPMSELDIEFYEAGLLFKMVQAFNKYLKNTDELYDVSIDKRGGLFEVNGKVKRDGRTYKFDTELIGAGGYNIQEYHYRYIIKTDLPDSNENSAVENIKAKMGVLKKIRTIDEDIQTYLNYISKDKKELKQGFKEYKIQGVEHTKNLNDFDIKDKNRRIQDFNKEIEKLESKKSDLISVFESLDKKGVGVNFGKQVKEAIGRKILVDRLRGSKYKETGDTLDFKIDNRSIRGKELGNREFESLGTINTFSFVDEGNGLCTMKAGLELRGKYTPYAEYKNLPIKEIPYKINEIFNGDFSKYLEYKDGGEVESLVKDAKSGNTPARDLNNYNDVLDLEADGMVGADSGLSFAKGGELGSVKSSKDENGNWSGTYLGYKFKLFNLLEGWSYNIYFYSPVMEKEDIYFSDKDFEPFKTKKMAIISLKNEIEQIKKSNDEFNKKRQFSEGGELGVETILFAVRKGEPDWNEVLITNNPDKIEDAKKWALANGFDRLRVSKIDMMEKPNFEKTFAEGGKVEDLFENYDKQPKKLAEIVEFYMDKMNDGDYSYEDSKDFLNRVNAIGYTFDVGLDNEPFNLRPISNFAIGGNVKPYDANMEGDSADMMFAEGGAISPVVDNWNEVPSIWKDTKKVKKVAFTNSPYDKGLYSIISSFLGKDDLRPILTGINFDENGITVTDAHKLISLPYPNKQFEGVYYSDLSKYKETEQTTIDGKYPNYVAIIPESKNTVKYEVDVYKLLQYTNVAIRYANQTTFAVNFKIYDEVMGFNGKFLIELLTTFLKLGYDKVYGHFVGYTKAFVFSPNKNYELGNDDLMLIMPLMVDEKFLGAKDMKYGTNRKLSVYYDFNDNEIHNADGSIAEFKMNYASNSVLSPDDVNLLQKLANGRNKMPILDYVKVEDGVARASDLDSEYYLKGVDLPNGIYKTNKGALEITMEAMDDYPRNPILVSDEDTLEFTINSDVFEYYVDKFQNVVGKDELRPVMQGICLHHTSDNKLFLAGTDANILLKVNITEYVDMPEVFKDMKFIIQPKRLYDFLNLTEHTTLRIKCNLVATTIESDSWSFYARNIDGNFPNYEAVIPREATKLVSVGIEPIKKAFNSEPIKTYIKEADKKLDVIIFNKEDEIFIAKSEGRYSANAFQVKDIEKLCETNVDFRLEDYYNDNKNVLLIMPYGYDKQTNFAFRKDLVDRVFKIINSNTLDLHYTEMNRAYLIPIDTFDFKATTKEHKVREQKPSEEEVKLVSTINEVNEIKEAIETLEMLLETATRKDKKEIKEAIEVLQMLLDTYEY